MHSIGQVVFSSENCDVSSIDLFELRLSFFEFIRSTDSEPAIWIRWRWVSTLCISSSNVPAEFLFWLVEFIVIQVKYLVEQHENQQDSTIEVISLCCQEGNNAILVKEQHVPAIFLQIYSLI